MQIFSFKKRKSIRFFTIFATINRMSYKSVRCVIDLLKKNGFVLKSQKGSHMKFVKGDKTVVVPNHGSKGVEKGTYYNILNQAGIKEEQEKQ